MTLDNRVTLLEYILGLDEDLQCSGEPEDCEDRCDTGCPFRDNHLARLSNELQHNRQDAIFLRCLVTDLETHGVLPLGTIARVEAQANVLRLEIQMVDVTRVRQHLEKLGARGTVLNRAKQRETEVRQDLAAAQALLESIHG